MMALEKVVRRHKFIDEHGTPKAKLTRVGSPAPAGRSQAAEDVFYLVEPEIWHQVVFQIPIATAEWPGPDSSQEFGNNPRRSCARLLRSLAIELAA